MRPSARSTSTSGSDRHPGPLELSGDGGSDSQAFGELGEGPPVAIEGSRGRDVSVSQLAWCVAGDVSAVEVSHDCGAVQPEPLREHPDSGPRPVVVDEVVDLRSGGTPLDVVGAPRPMFCNGSGGFAGSLKRQDS